MNQAMDRQLEILRQQMAVRRRRVRSFKQGKQGWRKSIRQRVCRISRICKEEYVSQTGMCGRLSGGVDWIDGKSENYKLLFLLCFSLKLNIIKMCLEVNVKAYLENGNYMKEHILLDKAYIYRKYWWISQKDCFYDEDVHGQSEQYRRSYDGLWICPVQRHEETKSDIETGGGGSKRWITPVDYLVVSSTIDFSTNLVCYRLLKVTKILSINREWVY